MGGGRRVGQFGHTKKNVKKTSNRYDSISQPSKLIVGAKFIKMINLEKWPTGSFFFTHT